MKTSEDEEFFAIEGLESAQEFLESDADSKESVNTRFLPAVEFKTLYFCEGVSDTTRDAIWKYLQLISFSVMSTINNTDDSLKKLFENVDETELKQTLEKTIEELQKMFESSKQTEASGTVPDPEEIHNHLQSLMGSKLGKIAMEFAEETAKDLNSDSLTDEETFQNMLKDPAKITSLFGKIQSKLESKIKSGEIKESELMEESMAMLDKIKSMHGIGDLEGMLSMLKGSALGNLASMFGLGKGAKFNTGAHREKTESNNGQPISEPKYSEEELIKMFSQPAGKKNKNRKNQK